MKISDLLAIIAVWQMALLEEIFKIWNLMKGNQVVKHPYQEQMLQCSM